MIAESALLIAVTSALLAGFAGSGHCVAMCGGMAGLLATRKDASGKPLRLTLTYNAGRITSYTLAGLLAGALGQAFGAATGLGVAAGHLRIISGAIIILAGLYLLTGSRIFAPFEKLGERVWRKLSPYAVKQLQRDGSGAVFSLGMLWGWLPCGLTWSMLAISASSTSAVHGASIMLAFGIGTLPALLTVGLAGFKLRGLLNRTTFRRGAAVVLILAGTWTAAFPVINSHASQAQETEHHHH